MFLCSLIAFLLAATAVLGSVKEEKGTSSRKQQLLKDPLFLTWFFIDKTVPSPYTEDDANIVMDTLQSEDLDRHVCRMLSALYHKRCIEVDPAFGEYNAVGDPCNVIPTGACHVDKLSFSIGVLYTFLPPGRLRETFFKMKALLD